MIEICEALLLVLLIECWLALRIANKHYPPIKKLKIVDGMIHHPTYGVYPAKVEFKQGMVLYPGQIAEMKIQPANHTGNIGIYNQ